MNSSFSSSVVVSRQNLISFTHFLKNVKSNSCERISEKASSHFSLHSLVSFIKFLADIFILPLFFCKILATKSSGILYNFINSFKSFSVISPSFKRVQTNAFV
ncbi:MAG: hypothetical protein LBF15_04840 [Candidatus Peribacteria bacterium]|jgi:hypothetical protein|nr:hypothetical protein [Candidatus Peribacteria bacterium]